MWSAYEQDDRGRIGKLVWSRVLVTPDFMNARGFAAD